MIWLQLFFRSWSLFLGLGLVFGGQGLLYTLVTYRGRLEGFSTVELGFLMSAYFMGYFVGSWRGMKIIASVGHVRVFGALASAASVIFLLLFMVPEFFETIGLGKTQGYIKPTYYSWFILRLINGFAAAVILIIAESWLNEMSDNQSRGKNLSLYMMFSWGAPILGNFLLWFIPAESNTLFILGSIFVSMAAIPILMSAKSVPDFSFPDTVSLKLLYKISPVGLVGCFLAGCIHGNFIYSSSLFAVSVFPAQQNFGASIASIIIAAGIFAIPFSGLISDKYDRRKVLLVISIFGCVFTIMALLITDMSQISLYIWLAIIGTMVLPTYSLSVAHMNDWLAPKQMISASATLVLVYSVGMIITPLLTGKAIAFFGPNAYFYLTLSIFAVLTLFCAYRMAVSDAPIVSDSESSVSVTPTMTALSSVFEEESQESLKNTDTNDEIDDIEHIDSDEKTK
ncbi:MFS transporter [Ostreibacterium oceani]|uniref:MFS transporter n=1 Tax=Ostreibacterium oceani TaxID=2654998 RepID=A0A6N7ERU8_9GAMM|nr:MFS transporter [Ostreibacterium oceani]MPV85584.1 MFS transporter [Ostreibacterium oceani]